MCIEEDNPSPNYFKGDNQWCRTGVFICGLIHSSYFIEQKVLINKARGYFVKPVEKRKILNFPAMCQGYLCSLLPWLFKTNHLFSTCIKEYDEKTD